jgi:Domain of unknown function (DUF4062)
MPDLKFNVMISGTVRDLPVHREEVRTACEAQEMFPYMMETLPASAADAMVVSKGLVDKADIYVGVFAFRYGYVPLATFRLRLKPPRTPTG